MPNLAGLSFIQTKENLNESQEEYGQMGLFALTGSNSCIAGQLIYTSGGSFGGYVFLMTSYTKQLHGNVSGVRFGLIPLHKALLRFNKMMKASLLSC